MTRASADTDHDAGLERAVTTVLRVGIVVSSAAIAAGTVVTLVSASTRRAAARSLPGLRHGALHPAGLVPYRTVAGVTHGLSHTLGPSPWWACCFSSPRR